MLHKIKDLRWPSKLKLLHFSILDGVWEMEFYDLITDWKLMKQDHDL